MELPKHEGALADIHEIQQAVQRASALTQQLLAFSRQQVLLPKPVELNQLVREAERMFSRIIGEDIDLRLQLSEDLPDVLADPAQLDQILLNLVINARDAMPQGGTLSIETRTTTTDGKTYVVLVIADTGTGMDEQTKEQLFEPFFTTKPTGTGLGLATVRGIVEQSGGQIFVTGEPGRGSTFKVLLPVNDPQ
jgi:two-component system cell cycle sensor histidine kinase/response regulator CckA